MGNFPSDLFVDPAELPSNAYGFIQLVFLLLVYGYILSYASNMISDGSELLLLIPALAGIVGSVVLPVLGAVPDGAIVLFSGLGDDAQKQLTVGVGALAGSTIMLLTVPWALCVFYGRVNLVNGSADYSGKKGHKLSPDRRWSLFSSGITPRNSVGINGRIMLATSISYFIIQGAAFGANCDKESDKDCSGDSEHWFALAALITAIIAFVLYTWYNVRHADDDDKEDKIQILKKQAIESHIISLSTAFERDLALANKDEGSSLLKGSKIDEEKRQKRFDDTLRTFFQKYDKNGDGVIDRYELRILFNDMGESISEERFEQLLKEIDTDQSGVIEFKEFAVAMRDWVRRKAEFRVEGGDFSIQDTTREEKESKKQEGEEGEQGGAEDDDEDDDEEEEVPEDIASLPPNQQRLRILWRAFWMMGLGTLVVLLFSDPMVDVLSELGDRMHIPAFYVAFVLAPIASNASELIASVNYAAKKTKKTITISLAALEGAACMNNTFCLGVFLCLVFFKNLIWEFTAETVSIIFVELALFLYTFKKTHTGMDAFLIVLLYPLSLVIVWILENVANLN